jgi:hypothetical protein
MNWMCGAEALYVDPMQSESPFHSYQKNNVHVKAAVPRAKLGKAAGCDYKSLRHCSVVWLLFICRLLLMHGLGRTETPVCEDIF